MCRNTHLKTLAAALFVLLSACGSGDEEGQQEDFYPVTAFILSELAAIDSLPIAVFRYEHRGGQVDTTIMDKGAFRSLALAAFSPDISADPLKSEYTEDVFMDHTLGRVTLAYTPSKPGLPVSRLEVLIDPETEKVKTVFLEKRTGPKGADTTLRLTWSAGQRAQLIELPNGGTADSGRRMTTFDWGMGR